MLEIKDLWIKTQGKNLLQDFHLTMVKGDILALIGESGSGKTISSQAIIRLNDPGLELTGHIYYKGVDLLNLSERALSKIRGKEIAYIFQEASAALNPLLTVEKQMAENYKIHANFSKAELKEKILSSLSEVEIKNPEHVLKKFPFQLSGGMRQRVCIAMSMSLKPSLIIADEATSSVDSKNKQIIIELLRKMNRDYQTAILFITHDLPSIKDFADRLLILKDGEIIEENTPRSFFQQPKSTYGKVLLSPVPNHIQVMTKEELSKADSLIEVNHLEKFFLQSKDLFGKRKERVLRDVSMTVKEGSHTCLIGESGEGKSTLVKCLLGFEKADGGKIVIKGKEIYNQDKQLWAYKDRKIRKHLFQDIQMVFQDPHSSLDPTLKIESLLRLILKKQGIRSKRQQTLELEKWFNLCRLPMDDLEKYPSQLSGGKKQRVAIIRALIQKPRLLICDEITSALDSQNQKSIMEVLYDLKKELKLTILMISHDMALVEKMSDAIYRLENGRTIQVK